MTGKNKINSGVRAMLGVLIVSTTMLCTLSNSGWAMLAPAQGGAAAFRPGYDRAADIKAVQTVLESKIVRERLKTLGMNEKEIESRLARLSDRQVHQLARDVKTLSPGGGIVTLLEIVVLVLLILFLVKRK